MNNGERLVRAVLVRIVRKELLTSWDLEFLLYRAVTRTAIKYRLLATGGRNTNS